MAMPGDKTVNDEGKPDYYRKLNVTISFLLGVPHPPAQRRAYTNKLSERAQRVSTSFTLEETTIRSNPNQMSVVIVIECPSG